jgi:arginase family enzyme
MGGYSLEELVDDLMASADVLSGNKRITADFVEYDPALDHARIGGHAAAMVVETLLDIVP